MPDRTWLRPMRTNDKFDQLQAGVQKAINDMGKGREADLTFTMPEAPTRPTPDDMER